MITKFDLEAAINVLVGKFTQIQEVLIFGSRRFNTDSARSDIDLLITLNSRVKPAALREFLIEHSTALDLFILENGKATSVANESYISDKNDEELIKKLNAVKLFDREIGKTPDFKKYITLDLDNEVIHKLTSLPNDNGESIRTQALLKFFESAQKAGLPAKPYLGVSANEASEYLIYVMKNMLLASQSVTGHGQAKTGWTSKLQSEYDFQNLFWIVVKPWLPELGREEVELVYDGNQKRSDFNLFKNQLVIELKHIKNNNDKINIVKTLAGLKDFYTQHPNIRVLLFGILVEKEVELDDKKWERDYSYLGNEPSVKTIVIRNT
ncbi:MAG: hypothetical protein P9E88_06055 [Candidatus Competibacter sp.]|nr:hypothetical protein [Candidatus Competibacter sp.]